MGQAALVTGATGFIGSRLCKELKKENFKQYLTDLSALFGKKPMGSVPYSVAWAMGSAIEKLLTPIGIRPPVTQLAVAVMGRDNDVDTTKAQQELGWRTIVSYPEAMARIEEWVKGNLLNT